MASFPSSELWTRLLQSERAPTLFASPTFPANAYEIRVFSGISWQSEYPTRLYILGAIVQNSWWQLRHPPPPNHPPHPEKKKLWGENIEHLLHLKRVERSIQTSQPEMQYEANGIKFKGRNRGEEEGERGGERKKTRLKQSLPTAGPLRAMI